ncbi:hypothetical protein BD324DRAFT_649781 [Kockovaella imperatae]|uniref:PHD-type domain-containing protein n=1 Tax=Kockovaella imperatae TaxID=4999 RepID=A0A1Y1UKA3_9TREE|nr:hypothetical protein BD324DRAFT_649781 [Kockovaella imperatae]ORX38412.1 hypothetical protein BD324DRAFT_649781 [Kockovaella imperatae]
MESMEERGGVNHGDSSEQRSGTDTQNEAPGHFLGTSKRSSLSPSKRSESPVKKKPRVSSSKSRSTSPVKKAARHAIDQTREITYDASMDNDALAASTLDDSDIIDPVQAQIADEYRRERDRKQEGKANEVIQQLMTPPSTAEVFRQDDQSAKSPPVDVYAEPIAVHSNLSGEPGTMEGEEEIDGGDMVVDLVPPSEFGLSVIPSRPESPQKGNTKLQGKSKESKNTTMKVPKVSKKVKPASKSAPKKTGPSSKKEKFKVDSIKESARGRAGSVSSGIAPSDPVDTSEAATPIHQTESVASDDDAVYCICRKPYRDEDEDVIMVACDNCDDWFHPACVGIDEKKLDLLDIYICAQCEPKTPLRTSYKRVCRREHCDKSLTDAKQKYCSSACAFRHMAAQVPPTSNTKLLKQMSAFFVGLPAPKPNVSVIHHLGAMPSKPAHQDNEMAALTRQMAVVDQAIATLSKRQEVLRQVIAQCDTLVSPSAGNDVEMADKKSKKRPGGGEDKPCGWDRRLTLSDDEMASLIMDELSQNREDNTRVCMLPKRRCDRHQGWPKVFTASLDLEMAQLTRRKEDLETQHRSRLDLDAQLKASQKAADDFNLKLGRVKLGKVA